MIPADEVAALEAVPRFSPCENYGEHANAGGRYHEVQLLLPPAQDGLNAAAESHLGRLEDLLSPRATARSHAVLPLAGIELASNFRQECVVKALYEMRVGNVASEVLAHLNVNRGKGRDFADFILGLTRYFVCPPLCCTVAVLRFFRLPILLLLLLLQHLPVLLATLALLLLPRSLGRHCWLRCRWLSRILQQLSKC